METKEKNESWLKMKPLKMSLNGKVTGKILSGNSFEENCVFRFKGYDVEIFPLTAVGVIGWFCTSERKFKHHEGEVPLEEVHFDEEKSEISFETKYRNGRDVVVKIHLAPNSK